MGSVLVQQWVSVDGFAAGPGGEADLFAAVPDPTPTERHNVELLEAVELVVLGRVTYEAFADFWPTATDQAMGPAVNRLEKRVASRTLTRAPWGDADDLEILTDPLDHLRQHRADPSTGLALIWGSIALTGALLDAGLIDELELFVAPILLRTGRQLFPTTEDPTLLTLTDVEHWPNGLIRQRYAVGR